MTVSDAPCQSREEMERAIKHIAIPRFRQSGFRGTYPHFFREADGHVDLFCFFYDRVGASFWVEVAYANPERDNVLPLARDIAVAKLRTYHTMHSENRWRLGRTAFAVKPFIESPLPALETSQRIVELLNVEAEPWWAACHAVCAAVTNPAHAYVAKLRLMLDTLPDEVRARTLDAVGNRIGKVELRTHGQSNETELVFVPTDGSEPLWLARTPTTSR